MASRNGVQVATGHWYDYGKTGWRQATYTVTDSNGVLILTALSTFIALVASSFWCIVAFILHQWKTHPRPHDGLHEQHLVILRNTSNPLSAIWYLLCTISPWSGWRKWWHWSKADPYARHVGRRTTYMIMPPLICWVIFVAVGIFSGKVASRAYDSNNLRAQSTNCGFAYSDGDDLASLIAYDQYILGHTANALNYVNNCYNESASILGCDTYPRQALNYTSALVDGCPFGGNRCMTETFRMETAWLDSFEDFGINAPVEDRIQIRKATECAVVNVTDTVVVSQISNSNLFVHYYHLGPLVDSNNTILLNYTEAVLTEEPIDYVLYNIRPQSNIHGQTLGWVPISDFLIDNGDVSLFFITFGNLVYLSPVHDPLFSATTIPYTLEGDPVYKSDSLAGVVGCVDYFQLQNSQGTIQTALASALQAYNQSLTLDLNVAQIATIFRFQTLFESEMFTAVNGLGTSALRAQRNLLGSISIGLPPDQWQVEVTGWFETNLAFLQAIVLDYVLKIDDQNQIIHPLPDSKNVQVEDIVKSIRGQCSQQIIRGITGYQSFSVLGMWTIICTGLFIIFVNLTLAVFVGSLQMWASRGHLFGRHRHQQQRWIFDSMFQLQRIAHQYINRSAWENGNGLIPITRNYLKPLNSVAQVSNDVPLLTPERSANETMPTGEAI